jgi:hypothetical protein
LAQIFVAFPKRFVTLAQIFVAFPERLVALLQIESRSAASAKQRSSSSRSSARVEACQTFYQAHGHSQIAGRQLLQQALNVMDIIMFVNMTVNTYPAEGLACPLPGP